LLDYCKIILSSKKFLCFSSGSATLAAALKKPAIVFYGMGQNHIFHHSKIHGYVDVGDYNLSGYFTYSYLKLRNKLINFIE
jgi:ADP-heptose:LPS heptosyltransferase